MKQTFVEEFQEIVRQFRDKTAVCENGRTISYMELDRKSSNIAHALAEKGTGRGDIITIFMPRGINAVCTMLGVLKAGAAFCFINTDDPEEYVRFIAEDTQAEVMIDEQWIKALPEDEKAIYNSEPPRPEDPALVVYTSGSTGNPEGVVNSHRALMLAAKGNTLARTAQDVFLSTVSFSFIAVVLDILTPLRLGATVHIAGDDIRKDPERLAEYIYKHHVTSAFFPPQLARLILPRTEGQLLTLLTGSEKVSRIYSEQTRVINLYGASETCGPVTSFTIDRMYAETTPVGAPYEGSRIYILDDENNRMPAGAEGEICICGQVANGYLNLPELTADRFVQNPYSEGEHDKILFRTNDIGKINENGQLEFIQRKDWMIKVRGYRVEPGEVEAAIMRHAPVEQAVVKGFLNAAGEWSLFAVYTAKETVAPEYVLEAIRRFLPDYMLPAFMEQLPALPVNRNGKIDRKNIMPPDIAKFRAVFKAPETETERKLCAAFEQVLNVEHVGVLDDFNLLGGDSMAAARLQAALPEMALSVSEILSLGTPQKLSALTDTGLEKAAPLSDWPLTFTERQMATEQGMEPDSVAYNINSLAVRIRGAFDKKRFQSALDELVKRHAILRSFYPMEKGEYTHRIARSLSVPVEEIKCSENETEQLIETLDKPFDLGTAPLFRCRLFEYGENDCTLQFCFHHIIMDGTSWSVFEDELFRLYKGETLPPLTYDYLDYAVWQKKNTHLAEGEAVFRAMFADGVPETEMPTVAIRPEVLPYADTDIVRSVPGELVKQTAHRLGVTQYGLLMAVLGMTLAKYCGTEDVVVGTAMSGRTLKEQENMIGMFVNTLPVRLKPAGDKSVADYVIETAQTIRTVKANQTYPFERLVPMLAPDRTASRSPVFDVIFNYLQELPVPELDGASSEFFPVKRQALAIDLMFEAEHTGDRIRLVLSYSRALYEEAIVTNFMEQYLCILDRIANSDGKDLIMDAAELPEKQRRQILVDFAGNRTDACRGKTIVELFREQAEQTPENIAATFLGRSLTYRELDDVTDRLAAHLAAHGAGRGTVVGIMVQRGMMMPVGALAALKTGAAYLPMDPAYPTDRLQFMLEDAGVGLLLAEKALYGKVPDFSGSFIDADIADSLPPAEAPAEAPHPEDLMILLYTSGTTGKPKGVMLLHQNLVNFVHYYIREYGICETDNIPAYASFGFDACMMDMYPTLASGACLHIVPEEMRLDLTGLAQYFDENDISVAFMTTQLGRQFAESMAGRSLRALSVGGETLVPIEPPSFDLYNLYGPTECTIACNRFRIDKLYDRVPIGRAVDNTALYVVDGHGRLAPVGTAGELCIAGRQVAKGYLNRPDLTEEKFVHNPFSDDPDYARMYLSGDVVRYLPSGDIDFVGRRDFQVKIRGFRVELTEIEGRIREFPGISDATVLAQDDAGGGKRVVAYIVSASPVDIKALNAFIEEKLPVYMVPAATMQIDSIPLNQNGKVNRRLLPKITIQAEEVVPPKTELEKQIFSVVSEILGTDDFGVTTDLMYAGLNSLSSIKAAALITEQTGKQLGTMELMREKTIEKIAALLENSGDYQKKTYEKREAYPLTQNQLGLYFSCIKDPGTLVYNIPFAVSLRSDVDTQKLKKAVLAVLDAHPYVKTHLALHENEPVQLRLDDLAVDIPVTDCTEEEYEKACKSFVRPFRFFEGPLFRIDIYRTPERVQMLCDFHHMVFDGGSMDIFLRDLASAYGGVMLKEEIFTSFDLALLEQETAQGDEYKRAEAFFRERLSDGEGATVIPADGSADGEGMPHTVTADILKSSVQDAIKGLGVTASNLFLAATAFVTGRFASTRDVRIASITNGRDGAQLQNNLGMLVKTLPVVLKTDPAQTAGEYLVKTQQEMVDILGSQIYSYLRASSDHNYNAQLLYAFQGGVVSEHYLDGEPVHITTLGLDRAKFPISINIHEDDAHYIVEAEYDDSIFGENYMQAFADCIAHTAGMLARMQDEPTGEISVMTDAQQKKVAAFNRKPPLVRMQALHNIFEMYAQETPDAPALYAADGRFTYAQLNARANILAHALLALGVQREDRIAFLLPRDSRILVSMLGIIKSGGAYIPVDPDYPDERIAHILSDSGARYILTDGTRELERSININSLLKNGNEQNPDVPVRREDICYIIYTSGSTGKPKGVMLTHGNIINYVADEPENRHVRVLKENRCSMASVTTVSFDMFLKEAFTTLMNGLTLVLADNEQSKNPDKLAELFRESGANAFNATPSRMLQYMELPEMQEALSGCRVIMAGGEGYPPALYERLNSITEAVLVNTYGPTEITVSCNGKLLNDAAITVGAPLLGVVEEVMDIEGNPLPAGVTGELWIGGNGVARGYFGNPEMTAERFVERGGIRYYKSGDLARWTEDGEIVILGRNDGQIKLRGLRIELGEIENTIGAQDGITGCVVLVKTLHGQEHLCAYYTADREFPAEELREVLASSLTKYMVPTAYLQLDRMPVTPNGKIDRKALPEAKLMRREEYEAPQNEEEQAYCEIFEDVLQLERVGATDNFFDLGGTSLLVTQVTIDASARGLALSYGDVFANPTPRELAGIGKTAQENVDIEEISGYDYGRIEKLLAENTIDALRGGELRELGNVCITGATGFLGIHVLREFIRSEKGTAYCVVRGNEKLSAEKRLKGMLVYYFSDSFDELFGSRIVAVDGDITHTELFEYLAGLPIDTYINCAANVKHFSAGTDIEDVNVGGVENGVEFCKKKGCRFIQVSTVSVAGMSIDGQPDEQIKLDETMLYFGQDLSNKYARSKFLAERLILEAAADGLDAKIMRVGNLMARDEDGEFQANFKTNNFLGRLKAYHIIGCIPYADMGIDAEFAPIDYTAKAVLLLAKTPAECRVFHPYNDHTVFMGDVVETLAKEEIVITPCEAEIYEKAYSEAMLDREKAGHLNSLIAYQEYGRRVVPLKAVNSYTSQALLRLSFKWPITTQKYLANFFDMMKGLGFFDSNSVL